MCLPEALPPPVPSSLLITHDNPDARDVDLTAGDGTTFSATYALAPEPGAHGGADSSRRPRIVRLLPQPGSLVRSDGTLRDRHRLLRAHRGGPAAATPTSSTCRTSSRQLRSKFGSISRGPRKPTSLRSVGRPRSSHSVFVLLAVTDLVTTDSELDLAGAVAFYGGLDETRLGVYPHPAGEARCMSGPILAFFGEADPGDHRGDAGRIRRPALSNAGVEHTFVVYPGAPHSFFDRAHDDFTDECADAWRTLQFLASVG